MVATPAPASHLKSHQPQPHPLLLHGTPHPEVSSAAAALRVLGEGCHPSGGLFNLLQRVHLLQELVKA